MTLLTIRNYIFICLFFFTINNEHIKKCFLKSSCFVFVIPFTFLEVVKALVLHSFFFYKNQYNWTLGSLFLKFSLFFGYIVLNLFLFSSNFLKIFHKTVMTYNTKKQNNDTTESQKEKKTCFNAHAGEKVTVQSTVNKQI